MSKLRVVILGAFFDFRDLSFIRNGHLEVKHYPRLSLLSNKHYNAIRKECRRADLLIIAMFGSSPTRLPYLHLEEIKAKKAYWSFDSHHQSAQELKHMHLFDNLFIAHSPYIELFRNYDTEWLPCCFHRYGPLDLIDLNNNKIPHLDGYMKYFYHKLIKRDFNAVSVDLLLPYKNYSIGDRNALVQEISSILNGYEQKAYIGEIPSGYPYMESLKRSNIIINVSLLDDLNIRNFECWAFNKTMITNRVPDHDKIKNVKFDNTFLFSRDLSDFKDTLEKAMKHKNISCTKNDIINNHHLIHRYVQIINKCLKTELYVDRFI